MSRAEQGCLAAVRCGADREAAGGPRMKRRPKIAVALYGLPRCSAVTVPSIERQILSPLRRCGDVRVYYHLFLQDRIDNPRSGEAGPLDRSNYEFVRPYEGRLERPPDLVDSADYRLVLQRGDSYGDDGASLKNLFLQLHSLAAVASLASQDDPDVVVFVRPDLLYHDPVEPHVVRHAFRHPRVCAIPGWQWYRGCNDRFAICGREAAEFYANRGAHLIEFCRRRSRPIESEEILLQALRRERLSIVALPLRASRVRLGGLIRHEQFIGRCLRRPRPLFHLWRARAAYALIRRDPPDS